MSGCRRGGWSAGAPQSSSPHDHWIVPAAKTIAPERAVWIAVSVGTALSFRGVTSVRARTASPLGENRP
jgi:hypothetical protein